MKPFLVLALCCSFFSSRATPVPFEFLDCDDPDVFKAVDTALKKYNGDRATGNQFALYMVMEAKRTAGPDTQFHLKYRIQETTCATEEDKLWQDCDYKLPAEAKTGECTAQVHMNDVEKTSHVLQDCKISPASPADEACRYHQVVTGSHRDSQGELKQLSSRTVQLQSLRSSESEQSTWECQNTPAKVLISKHCEKHQQLHRAAAPRVRITEATCLGCFHPISSDSAEVPEILKQAIQNFNTHSAEPALYKLVEIKEAQVQVVAGWNYIIKYEIEETNCSKDQFQDLTPECKITSRGRIGKCDAKAYQNLHGQIVDIASQCKLPVEDTAIPVTRVGCPKTVPKDSPELKELLKVSLEKYNSESNDDFHYKGGEIKTATVQVVAGQNYHLTFSVRKTNCSKKEFEKLNEYCEATSDSVAVPCEAQIHVIPWENKIFPQVNCSIERAMSVLLRRPPGFTPFRSFAALDQPNEVSCSDTNEGEKQSPGKETRKDGGQEPEGEPGHKHRHKHGHKHGHKHRQGDKKDHESVKRHRQEIGCGHRTHHVCGHKKHGKNGKHKHSNPESSEESNEKVFNQNKPLTSSSAETATELVNPGVAREETSTPAEPLTLPDTSLFDGLPDRPEAPLPRCPGKPWKQIMNLPAPPSFPGEFTNEDLLPSAVESVDQATENPTPPPSKDFALSDALP